MADTSNGYKQSDTPDNYERKEFQLDFEIKKSDNSEDGVFDLIISSDGLDSYADVMNLDGGDFSNFLKHGTVYYNHNTHGKPVATCLGLKKKKENGKNYLFATTKFHNLTEESKEIHDLVVHKIIKSCSIGFMVIESHTEALTAAEQKKFPSYITNKRIIDKWELFEYSIVNIPANLDAITKARQLIKELEQTMETTTKAGASISKTNADKITKAIELLNEGTTKAIEMLNEVIATPVADTTNTDNTDTAKMAETISEQKELTKDSGDKSNESDTEIAEIKSQLESLQLENTELKQKITELTTIDSEADDSKAADNDTNEIELKDYLKRKT